jgi:hypothetical protein
MTNVPKSTGSQLFQTESQLIFPGSGPFSKSFKLHLSILAKKVAKMGLSSSKNGCRITKV